MDKSIQTQPLVVPTYSEVIPRPLPSLAPCRELIPHILDWAHGFLGRADHAEVERYPRCAADVELCQMLTSVTKKAVGAPVSASDWLKVARAWNGLNLQRVGVEDVRERQPIVDLVGLRVVG
eukprot:scaffold95752_cov27-Tisochrysis_lutea.AAC.1